MNAQLPWQFQLLLGMVPVVVAWLAYRQATRANRITAEQAERSALRNAELERSKVDADAYSRAKTIYDAALEQLERQLAREQDANGVLRTQVQTLQQKVADLSGALSALRIQLIRAGLHPDSDPTEERN